MTAIWACRGGKMFVAFSRKMDFGAKVFHLEMSPAHLPENDIWSCFSLVEATSKNIYLLGWLPSVFNSYFITATDVISTYLSCSSTGEQTGIAGQLNKQTKRPVQKASPDRTSLHFLVCHNKGVSAEGLFWVLQQFPVVLSKKEGLFAIWGWSPWGSFLVVKGSVQFTIDSAASCMLVARISVMGTTRFPHT